MRKLVAVALATVLMGSLVGRAAMTTTVRAERHHNEGAARAAGRATDVGGDDGATDAAAAAGLLDEDCAFLLSGAFLNPLAAVTPGSDTDLEGSSEQLEAIADAAPDAIKDAMATLAASFDEACSECPRTSTSRPRRSFSGPGGTQAAIAGASEEVGGRGPHRRDHRRRRQRQRLVDGGVHRPSAGG